MGTRNVLPTGIDAEQVKDYNRAAALLWNVAGFRASRMTPEERDALYTAARVIGELADADEGREGSTR